MLESEETSPRTTVGFPHYEEFKGLLDAFPIPAFLATSSGRIVVASESLAEAFGVESAGFRGLPCSIALHQHAPPMSRCPSVAALSTGLRVSSVVLNAKIGTAMTCSVCRTANRTSTGEYLQLHLVEIRELQDEVTPPTKSQHCIQRDDPTRRAVAGIAHDLNNLLTAAAWHAKVITKTGTDPRSANAGAALSKACDAASALCKNLLDLNQTTRLAQVAQLDEIITDAICLLSPLLHETIDLRLSIEPNLPSVKVSRDDLLLAIMNIVLNARNAMPRGGELFVTVRREEGFPPQADGGGFAYLEIRDTGHGMSKTTLSRAFDPFFTTRPGGSGLGLFTVRQVVERAGGQVRAFSAPGIGSVFTLVFPALRDNVLQNMSGTAPGALP